MASLSKFQLIFFGVLIIAVLAAVGMFALNKSSSGSAVSNVVIWGTLPDTTMQVFLQRPEITSALSTAKLSITYVPKSATTFDQDVVEAIASGSGPDAVVVSQDAALQYLNKIVQIPYTSFSQRSFKDTYIQEAELFMTPQGIEAFPFAIDPMVMYWNRTLLTNAGISTPPTLWSQIYTPPGVIAKINKVDVNHNILKTALALGTYNNILNAKDILSLLMFQAGSSIVGRTTNGNIQSTLTNLDNTSQSGAVSALSFYTQFADPVKSLYSWNTALPLSRDSFTSGNLALYFGYASELNDLVARNPNLNFDVALMPQSQSSAANLTFGRMYGLAVLKGSANISATANAVFLLSSSAAQSVWSDVSGFPPVTRNLLAVKPASPFMSIFYTAALQSQGWLDPNRSETDTIFSDMVASVLSGSAQSSEAVQASNERLNQLLRTYSN